MFKRAMLALAFVGALVVGSLGVTSNADAGHGHRGFGYHGDRGYPVGYPAFRASYYGGYGPRYSVHQHRFGGWGPRHRHCHDYDVYYPPRSGVSFYFGF